MTYLYRIFEITYLDLPSVCKICAEIHQTKPTKRQTIYISTKIQVYIIIMKYCLLRHLKTGEPHLPQCL